MADAYPMANYNCAFTVIDSFSAYHDLFYLLMVGSGVGVRVLQSDADKLPPVRTDLEILHKSYDPVPAAERLEYTNLTFARDTATLTIGDSKEGWAQALQHYFDHLTNREYRQVQRLVIVYDSIRPKGERLKPWRHRQRLWFDDGNGGQDSQGDYCGRSARRKNLGTAAADRFVGHRKHYW